MDNNDFKVKIIDFYKDVDKPIIDNFYQNNSFKNILELSTVSEVPLLKKNKDNWQLKDKRTILKDIENSKKKKIKEFKNQLSKINEIKITDIKQSNNKLLTDLESIDKLKTNIENDETYSQLKNLSLLSSNISLIKKKSKKNQNGGNSSIKIIDIEETNKLEKINLSKIIPKDNLTSDSDDFIEIFSN